MANLVYIATSLDGCIADSDGGLDWLMSVPNPDGSDFGFGDFMDSVDAVVMGRITFEQVMEFGEWAYSKPVFVLSNSLSAVPDAYADKARIINGTLRGILSELHAEGYENLYIDGGKTIQAFLREDLIDEMTITRVPVLLGGGIPLFGELDNHLAFEHADDEDLGNGLVKSRYLRQRGESAE